MGIIVIIIIFIVLAVFFANRKKPTPRKAGAGKNTRNKKSAKHSGVIRSTGSKAGKGKRKWNRVHFFRRKKSTEKKVGHPVYVYGQSGDLHKVLVFTHTPEKGNETNYEKLKHNIDPDEEGKKPCYVKKTPEIVPNSSLRYPDKEYRIHKEDTETIKRYKK